MKQHKQMIKKLVYLWIKIKLDFYNITMEPKPLQMTQMRASRCWLKGTPQSPAGDIVSSEWWWRRNCSAPAVDFPFSQQSWKSSEMSLINDFFLDFFFFWLTFSAFADKFVVTETGLENKYIFIEFKSKSNTHFQLLKIFEVFIFWSNNAYNAIMQMVQDSKFSFLVLWLLVVSISEGKYCTIMIGQQCTLVEYYHFRLNSTLSITWEILHFVLHSKALHSFTLTIKMLITQ